MEFARDGQIVLNIAPRAVGNGVGQRRRAVQRALRRRAASGFGADGAVLAIYARENGAGTMFEPEAAYDESEGVFEGPDNETILRKP